MEIKSNYGYNIGYNVMDLFNCGYNVMDWINWDIYRMVVWWMYCFIFDFITWWIRLLGLDGLLDWDVCMSMCCILWIYNRENKSKIENRIKRT